MPFATEKIPESHKKGCENKDFCNVIMPSEDTKILEFNQNHKSDKAPFIIYADFECLIKKIDECKNNADNSITIKVGKQIPSDFSMFTLSPFKNMENKHDIYSGKDCMKKVCESLKEHAIKIIDLKTKKMKLLTE